MKILIIKPSSLGDIVQANPTLVALRDAYPKADISWLVFDVWNGLMPVFPDVDHVVIWKKSGGLKEYVRLIKELRKEKYDLVIDLQGLLRTAFLAFFSGAKKKIGVPGMKEMSWLFIKQAFPKSKTLNAVDRSLETVRLFTGNRPERNFRLKVPKETEADVREMLLRFEIFDRDQIVALVPAARGSHKNWPLDHFRELIGRIIESTPEIKIIILGNLENVRQVRHLGAIDLSGRTTLLQLAGILRRCSAVVGPDSGAVHLASAFGVPVVAIFGGSDVRETAPLGPHARIIKKEYPCSPCRGHVTCDDYHCLSEITPEEVFDALSEILKLRQLKNFQLTHPE